MSFLECRPINADSYQLQRAFEGKIPETYEEFCKQMKLDLEQSCASHPSTSSTHNPSNCFADKVESLLGETPYVVFDVNYMTLRTGGFIQLKVKGTVPWYLNFQPVSKTILKNQFPKSVPRKVQCASTDGSPDLWRYWLQTCSTSHTKCRAIEQKQDPFVPDRLIQILEDEGNNTKWRLVEKCHEEINTSTPYLTLSHCWGSHEHLKLTKEKHSVFREASTTSNLSKTYQDAFQIATSLGFHFIWIDSLCIIQGEIDDWKYQSSMMGSIYGGARCNIAATWATDGTDGCFSLRDPYMIDPTTIKLRLGDQFVDWDIDYYLSYCRDVDQAPLNKRAWVIQERYLARKQLNFSKRQVYWECLELTASEQYPNGCPNVAQHIERKPSMEVRRQDDFMYIWKNLRDNYSKATLSRKSDKLIALAGIASEFRKSTEDEYIAGLWKKKLHKHLCWIHSLATSDTNRSRISADIAPTWSWASLDGPVTRNSSFSDLYSVPLFQLTEFSANTCDTSQLTKLVLKGFGAWARVEMNGLEPRDWDFYKYRTRITDQPELMESYMLLGTIVNISWDENVVSRDVNPERWDELRGQREGVLLFMWVAYVPTEHLKISQGLVLRMLQDPTKDNLFVRMGVFVDYSQILGKSLSMRLGSPIYKRTIHRKATGYDENDNDGDEGDEENMLWDFGIDLDDPRLASLLHTVTIV